MKPITSSFLVCFILAIVPMATMGVAQDEIDLADVDLLDVKLIAGDHKLAGDVMRESDANQDGMLDQKEMENLKFLIEPRKFDLNRNDRLTSLEVTIYFANMRKQYAARCRSRSTGSSARLGTPNWVVDSHRRDDPKEKMLVNLLKQFQPDVFAEDVPLVVPVFGKGRALEVVPGDRLDDDLIEDLSIFLSGACSCQVKDLNPGFDLPLAVNWNQEIFGEDIEDLPPESGPGQKRGTRPELVPIAPGNSSKKSDK